MEAATPSATDKVTRTTPNKSAELVHLERSSQKVTGSKPGIVGMYTAPATSVEFQNVQIQLSAEIEATGNMDMLLRSGIPRKPISSQNLGTRFHIRVEELSQPKF